MQVYSAPRSTLVVVPSCSKLYYLPGTKHGPVRSLRHREGARGTCLGTLDKPLPIFSAGEVNAVVPRAVTLPDGAAGNVGWADDVSTITEVNVALEAHIGFNRSGFRQDLTRRLDGYGERGESSWSKLRFEAV